MATAGSNHQGFAHKFGHAMATGVKLAGYAKTAYDVGKMVAPIVTALL